MSIGFNNGAASYTVTALTANTWSCWLRGYSQGDGSGGSVSDSLLLPPGLVNQGVEWYLRQVRMYSDDTVANIPGISLNINTGAVDWPTIAGLAVTIFTAKIEDTGISARIGTQLNPPMFLGKPATAAPGINVALKTNTNTKVYNFAVELLALQR